MPCPVCPKEFEKQHQMSPGVVSCSEGVALVLISPLQWDGGDLTNLAFSKKKLKAGQLSVCRVEHTRRCEVYRFVVTPQLKRDSTRTLVGVVARACEDIRAIRTSDGVRAFCVVDAPEVADHPNEDVMDGRKDELVNYCGCSTGDYLGHAHLEFAATVTGNELAAAQSNIKKLFRPNGPIPTIEEVFSECLESTTADSY